MDRGIPLREAVRRATEALGAATPEELAGYIQEHLGHTLQPGIIKILLGSLQERAVLDRTGQSAYEKIARWKAENPEEARKLAAAAKKREAAAQRKTLAAASQGSTGLPRAVCPESHGETDLSTAPDPQVEERVEKGGLELPGLPC